jgi:hypothetical protein
MQKFLFLIAAFAVVAVLLTLMTLLSGETRIVPSEAEARAIADAILPQVQGSHRSLVAEPETNLTMTLHVDMSASMGGYVRPDTTFLKVIDYLTRQWTPRTRAVGAMYPAGKDYIEDQGFFREPANYQGAHDMSATIREFAKEPSRMHLLVTDSQPWDSGNNPAYDKIAGAINGFLTQGGRCVLILYRSAYRGFYPSPMFGPQANNQVFYDCTNRPFAVWLFAHGGCALNRVVTDLANQSGDLHWAAKIQFGEPDLLLSLADRTLPGEAFGKMGKEIGSIDFVRTGKEVGRVRDYQQIRVRKKALDDQGYVPLQFDVSPFSRDLLDKNWEHLRRGLSVSLDCWELPEKPLSDADGGRNGKTKAKSSTGVPETTHLIGTTNVVGSKPIKLEKLRHLELEHSLYFVTNTPTTNAVGAVTPETVKPRLVVAVPRPGTARRYAWVMTVGSKYNGSLLVLPRGFSTPDDRDANQCDRILKLDEMLNVVAGQTEKWGAVLFLSEYPK